MEMDWDRLAGLVERHLTDAPRYTSYPTAPAWREDYGPRELGRALEASGGSEEPLSLYAHVPFCRSLCHFCACNRVITRDPALPERYLDAIEREVEAVRSRMGGERPVSQLHWGGGTPTHLAPDQIRRLFRALTAAWRLREGAEVSIEVDPRVTTVEHVHTLRACGFNRLSLGVQDFDPRVQAAVHRIQPLETTAELTAEARAAGFGSVGYDLIYGLPFQTEASFARTLETILELAPDRVAIYGYAHVTWVAKQQRGFERTDLPEPAERIRLLVLAVRRLLKGGYVHVGMDHFARPGDELARAQQQGRLRRNFMGYTTQPGIELLGFGPSAISELRDGYAQSRRDLAGWEEAVRKEGLATFRGHRLSEEDRARREVISGLMCQGEVDAGRYRDRFGRDFSRDFAPELEALAPLEAEGLVERRTDGGLRVTGLGRLFVRNVAMCFDAYLPGQRAAGRRVFSRTV
ncbi:MAG: oxygen-independent coproporphyrinogen III oxidase [Myxococcota bacterium]